MPRIRPIACLMALLPVLSCPLSASADEAAPGWEQTLFIYGMGAAIDGTAQIGQVKVPVDVSISELFDALKFGAMAAYRVDNGTWSFTGDATYMNLGGKGTTEGGRLKGNLDLTQATVMATAGRRVSEHAEVLFGLGYVDLSTDLRVKSTGSDLVDLKAGRDASWVDPMLGLQYRRPLGDQWWLNLRGDIGGFGIGSDFMYHLLANLRWQASDTVGVVFGYRVISFDYEDGKDAKYQRYDLTEQGPLVGISISF